MFSQWFSKYSTGSSQWKGRRTMWRAAVTRAATTNDVGKLHTEFLDAMNDRISEEAKERRVMEVRGQSAPLRGAVTGAQPLGSIPIVGAE